MKIDIIKQKDRLQKYIMERRKKDQIDSYIKNLVINKKIPYVDVVAYQKDKLIYRHFTGDGREIINGQEKLFMYSATKPITAVCAMKLVEQGKLALDDAVGKYIPEYDQLYLIDENGEKSLAKNKLTVLNLLTMTGGLTYDFSSYPIKEIQKEFCKEDTLTTVKAFAKNSLKFEPGTKFMYSLCHDVLAGIVEVCSKKKFSSFVSEFIFEPLGMKNSTFDVDNTYTYNMYMAKDDLSVELIDDKNSNTWFKFGKDYESGGAGLISTVEDYSKFAIMLASGGTYNNVRILKRETIEQMNKNMTGNIKFSNSFTCVQGQDYGYGFGVRTRIKDTPWGLPIGEFGWDGAAGSYLMVDPVNNISVVIGMHVRQWPLVFRNQHLRIVEKIYSSLDL